MITIAFFDASNGTKRQIIAHLMPMPVNLNTTQKPVSLTAGTTASVTPVRCHVGRPLISAFVSGMSVVYFELRILPEARANRNLLFRKNQTQLAVLYYLFLYFLA